MLARYAQNIAKRIRARKRGWHGMKGLLAVHASTFSIVALLYGQACGELVQPSGQVLPLCLWRRRRWWRRRRLGRPCGREPRPEKGGAPPRGAAASPVAELKVFPRDMRRRRAQGVLLAVREASVASRPSRSDRLFPAHVKELSGSCCLTLRKGVRTHALRYGIVVCKIRIRFFVNTTRPSITRNIFDFDSAHEKTALL